MVSFGIQGWTMRTGMDHADFLMVIFYFSSYTLISTDCSTSGGIGFPITEFFFFFFKKSLTSVSYLQTEQVPYRKWT